MQRRRAVSGGEPRVALGNAVPGMAQIAAFQRHFPQLQVSVMLSDYAGTIDAVLARRADIGVLPDLPNDRRFERETLQDQDVVAILHPEDPLARNPRLDCRRLPR